ncbi:hypothetical protein [Streptomyces sp. NPDC017673]|uniref:hypothetical protein n=1 Tax=Streptomyces sp. NPDC017673 TaxID=3365005 RepID=UPI0037A26465
MHQSSNEVMPASEDELPVADGSWPRRCRAGRLGRTALGLPQDARPILAGTGPEPPAQIALRAAVGLVCWGSLYEAAAPDGV